VAHHHFGRPLRYTGFGARGLQVRDLLHPTDLFELIGAQVERLADLRADRFNVGGGLEISASLAEWTDLCREVTGSDVPISADPETSPVDVPYYVSDHALVSRTFGWRPTRPARRIVSETAAWIREHEAVLRPILVGGN
jgi:CDP-paratose 2-epimerase